MKYLQFSIKDILFVITLLGILCGWFVHYRAYAARTSKAEQDLKQQQQLNDLLNVANEMLRANNEKMSGPYFESQRNKFRVP